jgi:uncharacterized membrane protein YedE/YeeE
MIYSFLMYFIGIELQVPLILFLYFSIIIMTAVTLHSIRVSGSTVVDTVIRPL